MVSLVMVTTSLVMVATSLLMVATFLVNDFHIDRFAPLQDVWKGFEKQLWQSTHTEITSIRSDAQARPDMVEYSHSPCAMCIVHCTMCKYIHT